MPTSSEHFQPPLLYRVRGWLNIGVWRLPLHRRVLARISMLVYRNPPMPGEQVVEIVQALKAAGVDSWVSGGWGVDALAGVVSRPHRDLDLFVEEEGLEEATEVLSRLGYAEWYRTDSDLPTYSRIVVRDHPIAGRVVDVHPLDVSAGHVEFASGYIEGQTIPCLSAESQVSAHSNYRRRRRDRADLGVLYRVLEGAATALIVPVPAAEGLCDESVREEGMPAHVTLLHPFIRSRRIGHKIDHALRDMFANVPAFDFTLGEVRKFPTAVYLAVEPAAPFVKLVKGLVAHWPEHQPYDGAFDDIVPHVTVGYGDRVPSGLAERLPLHARAEEVLLMSRVGQHWTVRHRFRLSQTSDVAPSEPQSNGGPVTHGSEEGPVESSDRSAQR